MGFAWFPGVLTPHGVLPRDSHEISPTIGGGTQIDDFTKGFIKGNCTEHIRRRKGGQGGALKSRIKLHRALKSRNFCNRGRFLISGAYGLGITRTRQRQCFNNTDLDNAITAKTDNTMHILLELR